MRRPRKSISVRHLQGADVNLRANKRTGSQLSLAKKYHLPLFLHSRAAHGDFVTILREEGFGTDGGRAVGGKGGVVHSFTGKKSELDELVGFYFCSYLFCIQHN